MLLLDLSHFCEQVPTMEEHCHLPLLSKELERTINRPTVLEHPNYVILSAFHNNTVQAYLVQPSPNMLCRYQSQSRKLNLYFVIAMTQTNTTHRSAKCAMTILSTSIPMPTSTMQLYSFVRMDLRSVLEGRTISEAATLTVVSAVIRGRQRIRRVHIRRQQRSRLV
jgi:hypothetical protein